MFNSRKQNSKKIICGTILSMGVALSAISGLTTTLPTYHNVLASTSAYANDEFYESVFSNSTTDQKNYTFNTTSSSDLASPSNSGWTAIKKDEDTTGIVSGIVNLEGESWKTETFKTNKPTIFGTSDETGYYRNLMINSPDGPLAQGYKSNSISLSENSFYTISVKLYTHSTTYEGKTYDPKASIYLTGLISESSDEYEANRNNIKFEEINTQGALRTYTFYISTDTAKTINLELWLGGNTATSSGAVFFNKVEVNRYTEAYFNTNFIENRATLPDSQTNFIDLSTTTSDVLTNGNFENNSYSNWNILSSSDSIDNLDCQVIDASTFNYSEKNTTITAPGSNCSAENDYVLFMHNKISGYQGIESSEFTIEHHKYYRLSFWAKSECNEGNGAKVMLVDKSSTNAIDKASLTIATTVSKGSNKFRNDWTKYNFYIYGPAFGTKNAAIQIWLGTEESPTTGYFFVDDFKIEDISYNTYNTNSSSSNSTTFNFNNYSDSFIVKNSFFDKTENEDSSVTYPLAPAGWAKKSSDEIDTFSGVISTNADHFNANIDQYRKSSYDQLANPGKLNYMLAGDDNNVLMIGTARENNQQSYTSSDISLSTDKYYKVSFYVNTQYSQRADSTEDYGASVLLASSNQTLFDYKNIFFDDNQWHKFEFYIKTASFDYTANLSLKLENVKGYVFFDDVIVEESTEYAYKNNGAIVDTSTTYVKIDMGVENFDNRTFNSNVLRQTPKNWTTSEENNKNVTFSGIISTNDSKLDDLDKAPSGNANVLYIESTKDVNYKFHTKSSTTFNTNTYYKISVNILTRNLTKVDDKPYGASIGLSESNKVFINNISTNGQWKTYTIYFNPAEATMSRVYLGLGSNDGLTSGEVLFDNFQIETIEKDAYETEIASHQNESQYKAFIDYKDEKPKEDTDESTWNNDFNWLVLPSLFTALAIIIAIVGFYVRKLNINKKPKIKTKYDRRKTLDKDIDKREKIALRKQIISELNSELEAIDKEMAEYTALAQEKFAKVKEKINAEQENIKKQKIEIEIRKKEAKAKREKELKDNPELISNTKSEKEFVSFIAKLDKQEMALQKQLTVSDIKLANIDNPDDAQINKFLERKEFIKNEISKIELEIQEISKEEEDMWVEYKEAKEEAKKLKSEYVANKKSSAKTTPKKTSSPEKMSEKKSNETKAQNKKTHKTSKKSTEKNDEKDVNTSKKQHKSGKDSSSSKESEKDNIKK